MNLRMLTIRALVTFGVVFSVNAQTVLQDNFESGSLGTGWDLSGGVVIQTNGGANGTSNYVALAAYTANTGRDLGARFDDVATEGARDFHVDVYFRVRETTQRQFNMQVSDSSGAIGTGSATINLRYQAGWAAYSGSTWRTISGLGSVAAGQWYHLHLMGRSWGQAGACYDAQLSESGSANFSTTATNLTWFQNGNPSNNTARYFAFTTGYGNNPGFDVDEVHAAVSGEPVGETNAVLNISGTYPHMAVFSGDGEIGIGAVVPWADKLWFVTYPPHKPEGSPDKLWTVDTNLTLTARPESVGGTHANRFVHRESQQLVIGPYFIDTNANVRAVSPSVMPGRLTATARHLTDPTNRVFFFSMEEGLYEVDVNTLSVNTIYRDSNVSGTAPLAGHPGAHGKGGYTSQGRLVYANNGESGWSVGADPSFNGPAGGLIEHLGTNWSEAWNTVERKTFTEVTGPGGIYGPATDNDPIWSLGWDKRSAILKLLDNGVWHTYRLPKGSYSQDAFHGWYTEWPRIREITDNKLLMHMHGMFYYFPKTFTAANTAGIQPICTYLRMPVDYCWWNGQLVMGRDNASTTGGNIWAGQSHSAPWFGQLSDLEKWGPAAGFGGPWKDDAVTAGTASEPFLITGFAKRILHLKHATAESVTFTVQVDAGGTGNWTNVASIPVRGNGYAWHLLPPTVEATWARLVTDRDASGVTAYFHLANAPRAATPELFVGIADAAEAGGYSDGIIRPRGGDARTLQFAANIYGAGGAASEAAYYEIGGGFQLRRTTNASAESTLRTTYSLSNANFSVDEASVVYTEGANRFRLPKGNAAYDTAYASGWPRGRREVVTERQLFNAHGTFYELPLSGSGGFRRVRPVTTHNKHISDFGSWRGLFVIAGVASSATNNGHVFRAEDGQAALWFGNVDDLWRMGAPAGVGGPWKNSAVEANVPSDPYLMFGYERKVLEMSHTATQPVTFTVEVDVAADNTWSEYGRFTVQPGQTIKHVFPEGYSAHWVRIKSDTAATVTTVLTYGPAAGNFSGIWRLPDGNCQISFGGTPGQSYTVRASNDLMLPITDWTVLTNGAFDSESLTYTDASATNFQQRFYVLSMP